MDNIFTNKLDFFSFSLVELINSWPPHLHPPFIRPLLFSIEWTPWLISSDASGDKTHSGLGTKALLTQLIHQKLPSGVIFSLGQQHRNLPRLKDVGWGDDNRAE